MEPHNKSLVEQFNDEFKDIILPVTVFIGIETVVGFFGNLLVIYVFFFRYHICNFKYFVLCLAISDFASTLTIMPGEIITQLQWFVYPSMEICKIKSYFNIYTFSSQTFCLLAIAVDRYRKVCVPFGWQIQPRVACLLVVLINVIAAILAIPVAIFWGLRRFQIEYKNTNITVTICEKDEQYAETKRPLEYVTPLHVFYVMSFASMFILYILVARKLFGIQRGISVVKNFILTHSSSLKKSTPEAPTCSTADVVQSNSYPPSNDSDYSSEQPNLQKVSTSNNVFSDELVSETDRRGPQTISKTHEPSEQTLPSMPKHKPLENEGLSEQNDPVEKICESEVVSADQGHTLDVEDKQTSDRGHTLDLEDKQTSDQGHTIDVEYKQTSDQRHTLDVEGKQTSVQGHTLDVKDKQTSDQRHTLDAEDKQTSDQGHTSDAEDKQTSDQGHTLDVEDKQTSDQGHTSDVEDKQSTNGICVSTIELTNNRQSRIIGMQHEVVPKRNRIKSDNSLKQKTIAMLILTSIFILTAICYRTMMSLIANGEILQNIGNSERTVYFFFLRLYFINHVINPIVYYALDLRFRKVTKGLFQAVFKRSVKLQSDVTCSTA